MAEKPDNAEPRLPRFQFRLRTLLIGVALLGVLCAVGRYVAHEVMTVAARTKWYNSHPPNGYFDIDGSHMFETLAQGDENRPLSVLRRWLGDFNYSEIEVPQNITAAQLKEVTELFPEALVFTDHLR